MAVKMRLRREGKKKQPFYRVVVADVRSPRDGRFIEDLGYYHPLRNPSEISIDRERALHWLRNGVQPSEAVLNLLRIEGIWEEFKPGAADEHAARREKRAAKRQEQERKLEAARAKQEAEVAEAARARNAAQASEQAVTEDTQPDAQPPEETGALPPSGEGAAADGETTSEEDTQ